VQVGEALQQLVPEVLPLNRLHLLAPLQHAGQVALHALEHSVHVLLLRGRMTQLVSSRPARIAGKRRCQETRSGRLLRRAPPQMQQVLEPHHARVLQLQQIIEFAVGAFGIDEVLKGINDLFYCHCSAAALVPPAKNHPVGAPAHLLLDFVLFVDLVVQLLGLFHSEIIINKLFLKITQ